MFQKKLPPNNPTHKLMKLPQPPHITRQNRHQHISHTLPLQTQQTPPNNIRITPKRIPPLLHQKPQLIPRQKRPTRPQQQPIQHTLSLPHRTTQNHIHTHHIQPTHTKNLTLTTKIRQHRQHRTTKQTSRTNRNIRKTRKNKTRQLPHTQTIHHPTNKIPHKQPTIPNTTHTQTINTNIPQNRMTRQKIHHQTTRRNNIPPPHQHTKKINTHMKRPQRQHKRKRMRHIQTPKSPQKRINPTNLKRQQHTLITNPIPHTTPLHQRPNTTTTRHKMKPQHHTTLTQHHNTTQNQINPTTKTPK